MTKVGLAKSTQVTIRITGTVTRYKEPKRSQTGTCCNLAKIKEREGDFHKQQERLNVLPMHQVSFMDLAKYLTGSYHLNSGMAIISCAAASSLIFQMKSERQRLMEKVTLLKCSQYG